jgi:CMP-N,N'-diacetyllegionaminic acid synthase
MDITTDILCIIPARSGSKGIKNKNIKNLNGIPLMAHSIQQAQECKYNMRIIVSTDSKKYASIATGYGAEVPFIRPKNISQDESLDIEFVKHCLNWLKNNESYEPDVILQLRPTSPCRKIEDINKAMEIFLENRDVYFSLRSVIEFNKSPYKMYNIENNELKPLFKTVDGINEPYNSLRQLLPKCYLHNGYIDIFNANIVENNTISGNMIYPFVMKEDDCIDIDEEGDWKTLKINLNK